ncbi:hypothetical protein D046_3069B, partial [Vibrio parahaemolyticus V-223/04]
CNSFRLSIFSKSLPLVAYSFNNDVMFSASFPFEFEALMIQAAARSTFLVTPALLKASSGRPSAYTPWSKSVLANPSICRCAAFRCITSMSKTACIWLMRTS